MIKVHGKRNSPSNVKKSKTMSENTVVNQLKEIFPQVSEAYIRELCGGYTDNELDIEQLVEVLAPHERFEEDDYPDPLVFEEPIQDGLLDGFSLEEIPGASSAPTNGDKTDDQCNEKGDVTDEVSVGSPSQVKQTVKNEKTYNDVNVESPYEEKDKVLQEELIESPTKNNQHGENKEELLLGSLFKEAVENDHVIGEIESTSKFNQVLENIDFSNDILVTGSKDESSPVTKKITAAEGEVVNDFIKPHDSENKNVAVENNTSFAESSFHLSEEINYFKEDDESPVEISCSATINAVEDDVECRKLSVENINTTSNAVNQFEKTDEYESLRESFDEEEGCVIIYEKKSDDDTKSDKIFSNGEQSDISEKKPDMNKISFEKSDMLLNGPCSSKEACPNKSAPRTLPRQHQRPRLSCSRLSLGSINFKESKCIHFHSPNRASIKHCKSVDETKKKKFLSPKSYTPRKTEPKHPHKLEEVKDSSDHFKDPHSKFTLLCRVLTDADHQYLQSQSEKMTSNEELLMFISQALESKNYPKAGNKKVKVPLMEGFECTIEEFLREIPDPVAEFSSDNYIRSNYKENAEIYLRSRYEGLDEDVIREHLAVNHYNLTKVCEQLEAEGLRPCPYSLGNTTLHHEPCVFFHQEVWFIEHRAEIKDFMDSVIEAARVEAELNRPPTPPPVEEIFECGICAEDVTEYKDLGTCDGVPGHLFCKTCIRRSAEVKIGEGATTFPCLVNCGGYIDLQFIEEVLPPNMFTILFSKIQEEEVRAANIPGIETCPFCPYAYGPDEGSVFLCLNPTCQKVSCRLCRKEEHPGTCDMIKEEDEETARLYVEKKMSEALIRECYKCHKPIVKTEGCNKMTCVCGAKMCYICRTPVDDYSHFNGQGGNNYDRCELFSDENKLHRQPVEAAAQQALNFLQANNPGMALDPNKIVPK